MDYALIFNPKAGRSRAPEVATGAQGWLEERGHRVQLLPSDLGENRVAALAGRMGTRVDRIVILGGDGSVREGAAGLLGVAERTAALGVLPMGSGNVVARELALPLEPMEALAALEAGEEVHWDVGCARVDGMEGRHVFLAMAGVGFDANIAAAVDWMRNTWAGGRVYRWSGDVLYGLAGAVELCRIWPARFRVTGAEAELVSPGAAAAVICNSRIYGKGMVLAPDASPGDGRLDAVIRDSAAPWTAGSMMMRHRAKADSRGRGAGDDGNGVPTGGERRQGHRWQLDGDPMGVCHTLELTLDPGALRMVRAAR